MNPELRAIKSTRVYTQKRLQPATILVDAGVITSIESYDYQCPAGVQEQLYDAGDQLVLPGLVDSHVHVNEPGRTDWEGFDTATHSAAAGGITTLVDMPLNCIPVTTSAAALSDKLDHLDRKLFIDCGFWGGATADNQDQLPELLEAGVLGVKSFTIHSGIDDFTHVDEKQLEDAMRIVARHDLVHLIHAEIDDGLTDLGLDEELDGTSYLKFLQSRPERWENNAIAMVIRVMARLHDEGLKPRAHIVHLSSASALPMIRKARQQGLALTVETCPHYLCFAAETIPDAKTSYKCCPPIREKANQDLLWEAVVDGTIDCIVSDHSPCTPQLKHVDSGDLEAAWGGISGLQFGLSVVHDEAIRRGVRLECVAELMTSGSARIAGLSATKGSIAVGQQADFCIFDDTRHYTIVAERIHHKHKLTPYAGKRVQGEVMATILAGHIIYANGEFQGHASGKPILLQK